MATTKKIYEYIERTLIVRNPDGSIKGAETTVLTGWEETRDVPDAPGGKQTVFVPIEAMTAVRPLEPGDILNALPGQEEAIADVAAKQKALEACELALVEAEKANEAAREETRLVAAAFDEANQAHEAHVAGMVEAQQAASAQSDATLKDLVDRAESGFEALRAQVVEAGLVPVEVSLVAPESGDAEGPGMRHG